VPTAWIGNKKLQYIQMDFKITQVYLILPIRHAIYEFFSQSNKDELILKIGTHIEDTMMYQKANLHIPWDSQNPYNPRLNQKQALWADPKKQKKQLSTLLYPKCL
jgi:hypothetical protein